jgi:hypothetical protein
MNIYREFSKLPPADDSYWPDLEQRILAGSRLRQEVWWGSYCARNLKWIVPAGVAVLIAVFATVPERASADREGPSVNGPFGGNVFVAMEEVPNYAAAFAFTSQE